ncbi:spindle pole body component [Niveomyces insectorum RCEF 264]|uniref:Spindle pole body component n=1 Tax=Niveomyces insectorum RCEF 264 TaxID=1081102 RepID=A0A167VEZ5_9HYPO|nr:spindle pole body component [Niveomyces insectorum RCEF 264]
MDRRPRKAAPPPAASPARKPAPVLSGRINTAINGLIHHFVPDDPHEDEEVAQKRQQYCFNMVRSILEAPASPDMATDVNHTMDLIRKKLTVDRPNDAWRFSQLYSRLLALPVLNQKWAILYLLYQLSDSPDPNDPIPVLPEVPEEYEDDGRDGDQEEQEADAADMDVDVDDDNDNDDDAYEEAAEAAAANRRSNREPERADPAARTLRPSAMPPYARTAAATATPPSRTQPQRPLSPSVRQEQEAFDDAFARGGLKKLPPESARRGPEEAAAAAHNDPAAVNGRPPERDVALKSTHLADSYVETNPSETALLRDCPFILQGLDSATMTFAGDAVLVLPPTLPAPLISLLHTLAEPALLYRRLDAFVRSPAKGLLGQSLRAAISGELRAYLSLVATLESQIRRALATLEATAPRRGIGRAGVTLKRCVVWTREATMGLRLMALIAEESASKRGGQLISLIHGFSTSHGDPTVGAFAERLLAPVARPFYDILRRWIYDGELADPYREFFVREQQQGSGSGGSGGATSSGSTAEEAAALKRQEAAKAKGHSSVWNDKYEIDPAMIPSIVRTDFAEKVFLIGKSLNFIRHSCGDAPWVDAYSKAASKELRYGDTATLEAWIDEAYKTTMRRLMHLMTDKFHLFAHLGALKKYVLLGQGDFVALLMESLAPNLDRPATAQYRHTLTSQLDHALRGSNAQFEPPEILRRLDARMLQPSHGDTGWDCFTLEYKLEAPVDCVVTAWASKQYLKVFNFLWHVKRVEFALASTWHKCMTGARGVLQTGPDHAYDNDDEDDKEDEEGDDSHGDGRISAAVVRQTWKTTRGTLAEMVHWVGQLQYYLLFEVIEASWAALQTAIRREDCTLDDVITAHTAYLTAITHKGLLGVRRRAFVEMKQAAAAAAANSTTGDAASSSSAAAAAAALPAEDPHGFPTQLKELLRTMLAFRDAVDGLYSWAVSDFTRRQEADVRRDHLGVGALGGGGGAGASAAGAGEEADGAAHQPLPPSAVPHVPSEWPALQQRLQTLGRTFRKRVVHLLADLGYQKDADLRFLGVAMNFNDVYTVQASASSSASGAGWWRRRRWWCRRETAARGRREYRIGLVSTTTTPATRARAAGAVRKTVRAKEE